MDIFSLENEIGKSFDLGDFSKLDTSEKYISEVKKFLEEMDLTVSFKESFLQIINNVDKQIKLPEPGEQIRIRTQQTINLISIILIILKNHRKIQELTIATYTLNKQALSIILDMLIKNRLLKLNLLLASSYSFRDPEYFVFLKKELLKLHKKKYDVHLVFAWSHFKISLIKCGKNYYQMEGSMNYSQNNMAENLIFENNKKVYIHDYNFITNIMLQQNNKGLQIIC